MMAGGRDAGSGGWDLGAVSDADDGSSRRPGCERAAITHMNSATNRDSSATASALGAEVSVEPLDIPDGELRLYRHAFSAGESAALFQGLLAQTPWAHHTITVFGRRVPAPRLSAWYGDPGGTYSYSGLRLEPRPWTAVLLAVKETAEGLAAARFNSVLLNLYRDGRDSVGWHSDAEPELGRDPVIASVSLGAARRFILEHKERRTRVALDLEPGSVLVMAGATQHHWRHRLPKTSQAVGPRINLTFRAVGRRPDRAGPRSDGRGS
jgi:alkylated DNA repair dioxygenase AlkB